MGRGCKILAATLLAISPFFASNAKATTCECKQHPAEAEAAGTCSRTEDKDNCTLSFTSTPPEAYKDFVSRLQGLGIEQDPRQALDQAFKMPPEFYRDGLYQLLPALFAVSQRTKFQDATPIMLKAVQNVAESDDAATIKDIFANKGADPKQGSAGGVAWLASYGCVSLKFDGFEFMVKTRFSQRVYFCDGEIGE
ncbi:hypothetical protein AAFN88_06460 [Pelagibius sp. CAU 1746]|uniref:hypothetical protein n=1 Tax=Pelagibius sp. CAU 1746 TaxID=3140370 RepID=UPI00325ABB3B